MANVDNNMEFQENTIPYSEYCTSVCLPQHAQYEDSNARFLSYVHWPVYTSQEPISLAKSGFFYTGEGTLVRCFHCNLALQNWIPEDDPILQHVRYSPQCPYLLQFLGEGVLHDYRERIMMENKRRQLEHAATPYQDASILQEFAEARHPMYAAFDVRLSSFSKWSLNQPQTPKSLAEAGFFYTGFQDIVRCFVCDGGLQKWEEDDDPYVEHAKWFAQCPYILKTKGEEFVQEVLKAWGEDTASKPMANGVQSMKLKDSGQCSAACDNKAPVINWTEVSIAAQSVMDNGYSEAAVQMAVNKLKAGGEEVQKAQNILRILLDMEERGEKLPKDIDIAESIEDENKKLKDQIYCIECHLKEKNTLFLPCAHLELCQECSSNMQQCPRCRLDVKQKIKTYLS